MESGTIFAVLIIVGLVLYLFYQIKLSTIARREKHDLAKAVAKERNATTDILNLSKNIIHTGDADIFLKDIAKFILRTMNADGAATFKYSGDTFKGCGVAGCFPLLEKVSPQIESQLLSDAGKYNKFFAKAEIELSAEEFNKFCQKGFCYYRQRKPEWLPGFFVENTPVMMAAPIILGDNTVGCIIVTSKDEFDHPHLQEQDGRYLGRLGELIALSMEMIEIVKERKTYEEKLRTAREEGMLAISSGIIHNIGNAVTVAKLTANDLKTKFGSSENRPETLILEQIIPGIEKHAKAGKLQEFISNDEVGKQYPAILRELTEHLAGTLEDSAKLVRSLENKLEHISGIIELQQNFVGELGTENLTNMAKVLDSAITIFNETCDKKRVTIKRNIDPNTPDLLIDSSMMAQIFINLIKNAIEAIETENTDKNYEIDVSLYEEKIDGKNFVIAAVKDNGPGIQKENINKVFDFGFSTKIEQQTHGIGLHASQQMAKKYNGKIEVSSPPGEGACFKVILPIKAKG